MRNMLSLVVMLIVQWSFAQIDVKLTITNLKKTEGNLSIEFYRSVENYTKGTNAFKKIYVPVENLDKFETTFKNVDETYYAVKVYLDVNKNKQLDKSFFGIRKEPYGFSGDEKPFLREPTFEEAKILMTKDSNQITIQLNNNKGDD